jgi:hypothetical protein
LSNHSPVICQLGPSVMKTSRAMNNKNERCHAARDATAAPSVRGDDLSSNRYPLLLGSQCDEFAPLYLPLEASDVAGSGKEYHISSRRKGWTRMLVVPTLVSPEGHKRRPLQ